MEMIINYWAIVGATILQFIFGMIWYGPLFGKQWMEICGVTTKSKEEIKKLQKDAMPYYIAVFLFSLLTNWVLYHFIKGWHDANGIVTAVIVWLGFIMPMVAGGVMFDGKPRHLVIKKFLISSLYQLICFVVIGYIFWVW